MSERNRVEVVIGGEIITLVSSENEEYMQNLARYIDRKMTDMKAINSNASINDRTRTLFMAVNFADDYFKALEGLTMLEAEQGKYIRELGIMQEEVSLLKNSIRDLQGQLNQSRAELDKYIYAADNGDENKVLNFKAKPAQETPRKGRAAKQEGKA